MRLLAIIFSLTFSIQVFSQTLCPSGDAEFYEKVSLWNQPLAWVCPPFGKTDITKLIEWHNNSCHCVEIAPATVPVEAGWFLMGCGKPSEVGYDPECGELSQVRNKVWLPSYHMGQYEITFNEYDAFIDSGGDYVQGRTYPEDEGWGRGSNPVININQYDIYAFCNWLSDFVGYDPVYMYEGADGPTPFIPLVTETDCTTNCHDAYPITVLWEANGYRLPTEAEWIKAARGGCDDLDLNCDERSFPWGGYCFSDSAPDCPAACPYEEVTGEALFRANFWPGSDWNDADPDNRHCSDSSAYPAPGIPEADGFATTAPVGSFINYPSAYGCMDMAGNVSEFIQGWYWDGYGNAPQMCDPKGPVSVSGQPQMGTLMGGDWKSGPWRLMVYQKMEKEISAAGDHWGFRVMRRDTFSQDSCPELFTPPETVTVPEGEYIYGCGFYSPSSGGVVTDPDCWTRSFYRHRVTLSEYEIGVFELTFDEYDYFIENGGDYTAGRTYPASSITNRQGLPVVQVNHYDAYAYCNWLSSVMGYDPVYYYNGSPIIPIVTGCGENCHVEHPIDIHWDSNGYRLPTHMEWQRAARGDVPCEDLSACYQNRYPWGNDCPDEAGIYRANYFPQGCGNYKFDCEWFAQKSCSGLEPGVNCVCGGDPEKELDGFIGLAPVGSYPFPSPHGCYDVAGNAAEWVQSWYFDSGLSTYGTSDDDLCDPTGPVADPAEQYGGIVIGGSYNTSAYRLFVYQHYSLSISSTQPTVGFRIARRPGPSVCNSP